MVRGLAAAAVELARPIVHGLHDLFGPCWPVIRSLSPLAACSWVLVHRSYFLGAISAIGLVVVPLSMAVVMAVPTGVMVTRLAALRLLVRHDLSLVVHHDGLLHVR